MKCKFCQYTLVQPQCDHPLCETARAAGYCTYLHLQADERARKQAANE